MGYVRWYYGIINFLGVKMIWQLYRKITLKCIRKHSVIRCHDVCDIFSNGSGKKKHMHIYKIKMSQTYKFIVNSKLMINVKGCTQWLPRQTCMNKLCSVKHFLQASLTSQKTSSGLVSPIPERGSQHKGENDWRISSLRKAIPLSLCWRKRGLWTNNTYWLNSGLS